MSLNLCHITKSGFAPLQHAIAARSRYISSTRAAEREFQDMAEERLLGCELNSALEPGSRSAW